MTENLESKISRRKFLTGALAVGAAGAFGLSYLLSDREVTFEEAKNNPKLRREYVRQIAEKQPAPFPCELHWDNGDMSVWTNLKTDFEINSFSDGKVHIVTDALLRSGDEEFIEKIKNELKSDVEQGVAAVTIYTGLIGAKKKQHVIFFPHAFSTDYETTFLFTLNHEYVHARDFYEGFSVGPHQISYKDIGQFQEGTLLAVQEVLTYGNDEISLVMNRVPVPENEQKRLLTKTRQHMARYVNQLENVKPKSELEAQVIQNILSRVVKLK